MGALAAGMLATSAAAHTALIASMPGEGQVLESLERVSLQFSGGLLDIGASLTVRSDGMEPVELVVEHPAANIVEADAPVLDSGTYVLEWRVVAEDGHPLDGQIAFSIDVPAPPEPSPTPTPAATSPEPLPSPPASEASGAEVDLNGDFGEKVSQTLSPLDALLIALVGAILVAVAWFIARRVGARELDQQ